jgi:hypothetical protein
VVEVVVGGGAGEAVVSGAAAEDAAAAAAAEAGANRGSEVDEEAAWERRERIVAGCPCEVESGLVLLFLTSWETCC